jgi:hypothetical protein
VFLLILFPSVGILFSSFPFIEYTTDVPALQAISPALTAALHKTTSAFSRSGSLDVVFCSGDLSLFISFHSHRVVPELARSFHKKTTHQR